MCQFEGKLIEKFQIRGKEKKKAQTGAEERSEKWVRGKRKNEMRLLQNNKVNAKRGEHRALSSTEHKSTHRPVVPYKWADDDEDEEE